MLMQTFGIAKGFEDLYQSKVIDKLVKDNFRENIIDENEHYKILVITKKDLLKLLSLLNYELMKQRELSKKRDARTRTLVELELIIGLLNIVNKDKSLKETEVAVKFVFDKKEELLDL